MEQTEKKTVTQNAEKYIREAILRDVLELLEANDGKPFEEKKKEITDYLRNCTEDSHADALADIAGEEQRCQILNQKFWGAGNVISAGNRITMRRVQESDREGYLEIKRAYLVTKHMLKEPTYSNTIRSTARVRCAGISRAAWKRCWQEPFSPAISPRAARSRWTSKTTSSSAGKPIEKKTLYKRKFAQRDRVKDPF